METFGITGFATMTAGHQWSALTAACRAIISAAERDDRDLTASEKQRFDAMKARRDALERTGIVPGRAAPAAPVSRVAAARAQLDAEAAAQRHVRGPEARRSFENLGEFLAAVRFNRNDQRLAWQENPANLRGEMRTDDGPSGGFAIPPQFRDTLLRLRPQDAIVRPRAFVIEPGTPPDAPVSIPALDQTGAAPGNAFGGVQVGWIGEGGPKPLTDMKLREVTLTPHEVAGTLVITDKLLRNWGSSSALIEMQFRGAMTQAEDIGFVLGNGVGKPLGFVHSPAAYRVPRLQAGRVTYLDLVAMEAKLIGSSAVIAYSKSVLPQLMTLQNPNGQYIWSASAVPGQPNTLLGRPAIEYNRNSMLGQLGDVWMADLSQYLIKDGSGPYVAASEHVLFAQNKTVIKAFWNVDGAPWLTAPMQLENGDTGSPFVVLDVPAV